MPPRGRGILGHGGGVLPAPPQGLLMRATIAAILFGAAGAVATAQTVTVLARATIGSTNPPNSCTGQYVGMPLPTGFGRVVRVIEVSGSVSAGPNWPFVGADGGTAAPCGSGGTDIPSTTQIAGIVADRTMFLCGLFLGDWENHPTVPPRLEFTGPDEFSHLWTALRQPFFIGDGRQDGTGAYQTFAVPDDARMLAIGFAEGVPCFEGPWGGNCDNQGELRVTLSYDDSCLAVMEPSGSRVLCMGDGYSMETNARGVGPVEFQWEVHSGNGWVALTDGLLPTGGGTLAQGSNTGGLVLTNAQPGDFHCYPGKAAAFPMLYFRLWATGCDSRSVVATREVHLRHPDLNCDGNVDQDDLLAFLSTKLIIDLNEDGNADMDDVAYLIDWIASDPTACR